MKTKEIKLAEAIINRENFIKEMQKFSNKRLEKHLDLFREQMEIAYNKNNADAINLLYEYETQVVAARYNKNFK